MLNVVWLLVVSTSSTRPPMGCRQRLAIASPDPRPTPLVVIRRRVVLV